MIDGERMELAGLAHRRYPDMPVALALECFLSDRRQAGLGALDERRRKGVNVRNYKRDVWEHGQVRYHLIRSQPERMEYARQSTEDFDWSFDNAATATATVQMVRVPERNDHLCVPADYHELRDQKGRRMIAASLRRARRQLSRKGAE